MDTTATTGRTIEQILAIRLRAAQLRVNDRTMDLVKDAVRVEQGWEQRTETERAKTTNALRLATDAVALVQREIDSQQGLPVEPVQYNPTSHFEAERYAVILMTDYAALGNFAVMDAEEALRQAHQDAAARFEDWYARYGEPDVDEGSGEEI
jgi:hypothetical protein